MKSVKIERPASAAKRVMPVEEGSAVTFAFDTADTSFERQESDLVLTFEDGGQLTLEGFFKGGDSDALPDLVLEDGTEISAADFLLGLDPNFDISTAAGPGGSVSSSGAGSYADDAGNLLGGLDRLGSLGTDFWSGSRQTPSEVAGAGTLLGDAGDAGGTPGVVDPGPGPNPGPDPNPGPEPQVKLAHSRLIVTNDESASSYKFYAQDSQGNLIKDAALIDSIAFKEGASDYFTWSMDHESGEITVTLTQAGKDAITRGERFDDMLIISMSGEELAVDLYARGDDDSYDWETREQETQDRFEQPLLGEWYASHGKTIDGEGITLGGTGYNQADVIKKDQAAVTAVRDINIEVVDGKASLVNIEAHSEHGEAKGLETTSGGSSSITAGVKGQAESEVRISARSEDTDAYGVHSLGTTDIYATRADIRAESDGGNATGIRTGAGAATTVRIDESLNIVAKANGNGNAYGVRTEGGGTTRLIGNEEGGSTISVSAESGGTNWGKNAEGLSGDSRIEISKDNNLVEVSATGTGGTAYDGSHVYGMRDGAGITLDQGNGNTVRVSGTSEYGQARGMQHSTVSMNGDRNVVEVSAKAAQTAVALNDSTVTLTGNGNTISLSAETTNNSSDGYSGPSKAPWQAHGMWNSTIETTGESNTVDIAASSSGYGEAYGMMSGSVIRANGSGEQDITITAINNNQELNPSGNSDSRAIGMRDSSIYHEGTGKIHITTQAEHGEAIGIFAGNTIDAREADLQIDSHSNFGKSQGIAAWQWNDANGDPTGEGHNEVYAKNINITVSQANADDPNNGWPLDVGVYGLSARHYGHNIVEATEELNITVSSDAANIVKVDKDGNAVRSGVYGMEATGEETYNEVNAGSLNLEARGNEANVYGLFADDGRGFTDNGGGRNRVNVAEDATISASSVSGDAYGTYALGEDSENNVAVGGKTTIAAHSDGGNATGVYGEDKAATLIESGGDLSVAATSGSKEAVGVTVSDYATAHLTSYDGDVSIIARSTGGDAVGIRTEGAGEAHLNAYDGDISVIAGSTDGEAMGVHAFGSSSRVEMGGKNVLVDAHSVNNRATGMLVEDHGVVQIQAQDSWAVKATSNNAEATGLHLKTGGNLGYYSNDGTTTISAEGKTGATGILVEGNDDPDAPNTKLELYGTDDLTIKATSTQGPATGIHADNGGQVNMSANQAKVIVEGYGTATGILMESGANGHLTGYDTGSVTVTSHNGSARGIHATGVDSVTGEGSAFHFSGNSVEATGKTQAMGVWAQKGGTVSAQVDSITATATGDNGRAFGVIAEDQGSDIFVQARERDLSITAQGDAAMTVQAYNGGSVDISAAGNITITANGGTGAAEAVAAYGTGQNDTFVTITSQEEDVTISADATSEQALTAGILAMDGGQVEVTAEKGSISISAHNKEGSAVGVLAESGDGMDEALLSVRAKEGITITAETNAKAESITADATAVRAHPGGRVHLLSEQGDIAINAYAADNVAKGTDGRYDSLDIEATEGSVRIDVAGGKEAYGMEGGGRVTAGTDVEITVQASGQAEGIHGYEMVDINAGRDVTMVVSGDQAIGVRAHKGQATINAGSEVSINVNGTDATGILANDHATVNINAGDYDPETGEELAGTIRISAEATTGHAAGISANGNSNVSIQAKSGGTATIEAVSEHGTATGISATHKETDGDGNTFVSVTGGEVVVDVKAKGDATGIRVEGKGAGVSIYADKYDDPSEAKIGITVASVEGAATGISVEHPRDPESGERSRIEISGEKVDIDVKAHGDAMGIRADNAEFALAGTENIAVTVDSTEGKATGIELIDSDGYIKTEKLDITVNARDDAMGMRVENSMLDQPLIDALNISATSTQGTATGLHVTGSSMGASGFSSGDININVDGDAGATGMYLEDMNLRSQGELYIKANSDNGAAAGFIASGSDVAASFSTLNIDVTAREDATGILFKDGSSGYLDGSEGGSVSVTSKGGNATGIRSTEGSHFSMATASVTVSGAKDAYGVMADKGGDVEIQSNRQDGGLDITVKAGSGVAQGVTSHSDGADQHSFVNLTAAGDVTINATSAGSAARGIMADSQDGSATAHNEIRSGGSVEVTATAGDGDGIGVWANADSGKAWNTISAAGDISITAESSGRYGYGLLAETHADGVGATNTLEAGGNVSVKAAGVGEARAMAATARNAATYTNEIIAGGDVSLIAASEATGSQSYSMGMAAVAHDGGVAINRIQAEGKVTLSAENANTAYGMNAQTTWSGQPDGQKATNEISADSVKITATASDGVAYGMNAVNTDASNTITANSVDIAVNGGANSIAMRAVDGGINEIFGKGENGLTVTITAESGSLDKAIALFAERGGSVNHIKGTDGGDTISIKGDIIASGGGENRIETGGGNDSITLNGRVEGALHIHTGAGEDALILTAASYEEFMSFYGGWLQDCSGKGYLSGINDLHIDLGGIGIEDVTCLYSFLQHHLDFLGLDNILFRVDGMDEYRNYDGVAEYLGSHTDGGHSADAAPASSPVNPDPIPDDGDEAYGTDPVWGGVNHEQESAFSLLDTLDDGVGHLNGSADEIVIGDLLNSLPSIDPAAPPAPGLGVSFTDVIDHMSDATVIALHDGTEAVVTMDELLAILPGVNLSADKLDVEDQALFESLTNGDVRICEAASAPVDPGDWGTAVAEVTYDGRAYEVYCNDSESDTNYLLMQSGINIC